MLIEAKYYDFLENKDVACKLCPHNCIVKDKKTGICGVRRNIDGKFFTDIYGKVSSIGMDPIEKKPLYHFYPGQQILSIGTVGCNMKCVYCQNWNISQDIDAKTVVYEPEKIVKAAVENNSIGIAYTYSEPIIWFEYVLDCARIGKQKGLKNVLVTNGFINPDPLDELLNYIDAMNIDLKAYKEETYKRVQKARLEDVKNTIVRAYEKNCHIEITTLIVTGINDNMDEMKEIINFISSIDKNIPWHISRYYPNYKYEKPATSIDFIREVYEQATEKLNFVYCGNVPFDFPGNKTICPSCGVVAIDRSGYLTRVESLNDSKCGECGAFLNVVGK
jgi:pyruvate formate lyase activating enzyme